MPRRYRLLVNIVALSLIIYIGVDIFYRIVRSRLWRVNAEAVVVRQPVRPEAGVNRRPRNYQVILDRNIFGAGGQEISKDVSEAEIEGLEPTSLKVALLGTVTGGPQYTYAVIEDRTKNSQELYRVGDSVQDATVRMILREKVVLRVDDKDEILTMEEPSEGEAEEEPQPTPTPSASQPESTIDVQRSEVESSLEDIHQLLSQVRVRPHFQNGQPNGLALTRIKPYSIFSKMGLKSGDIVRGVNGRTIQSPDDMLALYENLKSGAEVSVQILRGNEPKTIQYRFR